MPFLLCRNYIFTFSKIIQLSESPLQNKTSAALTCPSHIDSPPEGPNQFLLFWVALPAWTCSGHQRHSSIRPGWLWLIYPPNNQSVSLSHSFSSFPSLGSSSLCLLRVVLPLFCWCAEYDEKVRARTALTRRHVESNNAIPFWPWRTTNSYVHLSIFLTGHLSFRRKPTDSSCKQRAMILRYFGPVDLWQSGCFHPENSDVDQGGVASFIKP